MEEKERQLIGKGRISSIYSDGVNAYKTFPKNYNLDWINYEVIVQNEIYKNTKLSVVKYEINENAKEIKMDLIKGITLANRMRIDKYKNGLQDLVNIQKMIYSYSDLNIPNAHDAFIVRINNSNLDKSIKENVIESLKSIERKNILCHFDLHFENIMFDGERYFIIDWVDAKLANPSLDVARSYIIFKEFIPSLADEYIKLVNSEISISKEEINKALPIIAAIRLLETDNSKFKETLKAMINGDLKLK